MPLSGKLIVVTMSMQDNQKKRIPANWKVYLIIGDKTGGASLLRCLLTDFLAGKNQCCLSAGGLLYSFHIADFLVTLYRNLKPSF